MPVSSQSAVVHSNMCSLMQAGSGSGMLMRNFMLRTSQSGTLIAESVRGLRLTLHIAYHDELWPTIAQRMLWLAADLS